MKIPELLKEMGTPELQLILESVETSYEDGRTAETPEGSVLEDTYNKIINSVKSELDNRYEEHFITIEQLNWVSH